MFWQNSISRVCNRKIFVKRQHVYSVAEWAGCASLKKPECKARPCPALLALLYTDCYVCCSRLAGCLCCFKTQIVRLLIALCCVAAHNRHDGKHPSWPVHVCYAHSKHINLQLLYAFYRTPQPLRLDVKVRDRKQMIANLHQTAAPGHTSSRAACNVEIKRNCVCFAPQQYRVVQKSVTTS